eukprot:747711-Hanusia_phi.AAC.1
MSIQEKEERLLACLEKMQVSRAGGPARSLTDWQEPSQLAGDGQLEVGAPGNASGAAEHR